MKTGRQNQDSRFHLLGHWILLTGLFVILSIIAFDDTAEDAYITFRYAQNIADGHGPVFNPGGEAVEGYSNPLWTWVLTGFSFLGVNVVFVGRCLGLLFGALIILEILLLFRLNTLDRPGRGITAALAVVTAPAFLYWSQAGLENALYIWLMLMSVRLFVLEARKPEMLPFSSLALLLLALTRPEGIMFALIFVIWKFGIYLANKNKYSLRQAWLSLLVLIVFYGLFLIGRLLIFGQVFPNTFYAKVNNGLHWKFRHGLLYIISFLNHTLWLPLILPFIAWILSGRERKNTPNSSNVMLTSSFAVIIGVMVFILYAGGDIHPNDRFALPILVLVPLIIFSLAGNTESTPFWKSKLTLFGIILIAGNLFYSFPPAYTITPDIYRPPNFLTANLASLVSGRTSPVDIWNRFTAPPVDSDGTPSDPLEYVGMDLADCDLDGPLAVDQCGKIPFFSGQPVIDLLGLNDPEIAHVIHSVSTWDLYARAVLMHKPGMVVFFYSDGHPVSRYYMENLVVSEPFQRRYELDKIYSFDYFFRDVAGNEYSFKLEFIRYSLVSFPDLAEEEIRWFEEHDPMVETPDIMSAMVEEFRSRYSEDPEKVVNVRFDMN